MCRPVVVINDQGKLLEVFLDKMKGQDPRVKALDALQEAPAKDLVGSNTWASAWHDKGGSCSVHACCCGR